MTTPTNDQPKVLFVGPERLRPQIAYVLDIPNYATAEKLTFKNYNQYQNCQIYVCDFKRKSRRYVKFWGYQDFDIQYLDDICRQIDEEYYANRKRHAQENNLQNVKVLPAAADNQVTQKNLSSATTNPPARKSLWRRVLLAIKHPIYAVKYVMKRIKKRSKKIVFKYKKYRKQYNLKKQICKGNLKVLQHLQPSELLLFVLQAKPKNYVDCTYLETEIYIASSNDIKGCCSVMVPFGNLLLDGE
ncbi:MAG: hypothetical protein NC133_02890, partial [Prevotella sp.]|nr:hypothetical protein [Prevotella sp.]